jgi:nucleoside-diphosphate-sugar epimerase
VLLTGHDGYLGAAMRVVLRAAGHEVVGLDTYYFRGCEYGADGTTVPALVRDIRDVTPADLEGFEAVVHLAALSNDPMGNLNPSLTADINFHASLRLAEHAREAGVSRYLFSSSCSVYGASGELAATEESPMNPLTPYAVSKVRTEEAVRALATQSFSPVFMRNGTVYGVSARLRLDLVLNNLVAWAYTTGKVRLESDGSPRRPLVHVEDVARAFAAVLAAPREAIHNQAFNVGGNSENYQIRDLAEIVRVVVPGSTIEFLGTPQPDQRDYRVDFSKLPRALAGFAPVWNARSGAEQLYESYRLYDLTREELEAGHKYIRLRHLRRLMDAKVLSDDLRWDVN